MTKSRLVLVLHLIGGESGASFPDQSEESKPMQFGINFHTKVKRASSGHGDCHHWPLYLMLHEGDFSLKVVSLTSDLLFNNLSRSRWFFTST